MIIFPPLPSPAGAIVGDSYLIVNDVNWGIVELQERSGRFAWYSTKNGLRRQSRFFASACEAIEYSRLKGMRVDAITTWILPPA